MKDIIRFWDIWVVISDGLECCRGKVVKVLNYIWVSIESFEGFVKEIN